MLEDILREQRITNSLLKEAFKLGKDFQTLEDAQISSQDEDAEIKDIYKKYTDIMGIVDNHPLFKMAYTSEAAGGWGIFPQVLTNYCKQYGVKAVLKGIRFVHEKGNSIKSPRAFLLHALKNGQFGSSQN